MRGRAKVTVEIRHGGDECFRQFIRRERVRHEARREAQSEKCVGSQGVKATASGWRRHVWETSEHYLEVEPMKKKRRRQYRCISRRETRRKASLIITWLSGHPPRGPRVTITDAPRWQVGNTDAKSNTRRGERGRQPGDEPEQCFSPRRHNHHDQLGGRSKGLLFYIRTAISLRACAACRVFIPILEGCLLNVGGRRQRSMWSKVESIWRSSPSKANKLCQVGLLDSPPPPPPLSPQTCRDDLQINRKIGAAAGEPPFQLWLRDLIWQDRVGVDLTMHMCVCMRACMCVCVGCCHFWPEKFKYGPNQELVRSFQSKSKAALVVGP